MRRRYDIISNFIISTIKKKKEISFQELFKIGKKQLTKVFDGKALWFLVTVKLDLEARKIIERVPKTSPHKLR